MNSASGIKQPNDTKTLRYKDGKTKDIQKVVLSVNAEPIRRDTEGFSKQYKADKEGLRELWRFVKSNIRYKEDPDGYQFIKTPARLWRDGEGDCKSFTLFIVSVLQNLKIPYTIRFARYQSGPVTHVYPIAHLPKQDVILDAVWQSFDREKQYYGKPEDFKFGKNMSEIYKLGSIGASISPEQLASDWTRATASIDRSVLKNDVTQMTELQFYNFLGYNAKLSGVGNLRTNAAFTPPIIRFSDGGVSGIGAGKIVTKVKEAAKKVGAALKEAWAKFTNWLFKGILEKASPFFLFTFLKKNVSPKIAAKLAQQNKLLNFIAKASGIDRAKLDASIRVGITKQFGKSPEAVLNAAAKSSVSGIEGIGIVPAVAAAIPVILDIIKKIVALFKPKAADVPTADAKSGSDLEELGKEAQATDTTQPAGESNNPSGKIVVKETPADPLSKNDSSGSSNSANNPDSEAEETDTTQPSGKATSEKSEKSEKKLEKPTDKTDKKADNTGLLVAGAAVAIAFFVLSK